MESTFSALTREYTVNNVKFQVAVTYRRNTDEGTVEDFTDKMKRLILNEAVIPRKK